MRISEVNKVSLPLELELEGKPSPTTLTPSSNIRFFELLLDKMDDLVKIGNHIVAVRTYAPVSMLYLSLYRYILG